MDFSVILCTYNRSGNLDIILQSLEAQVLPVSFSWETIVVDNNSTDDTPDRIKEFSSASSLNIKYVKELNVGLSHARNRGVVEAEGKYVLFVEDDEIADKNLIREIYQTFNDYNCDCVGGRIYLKFEDRIPPWLAPELWGFLGHLDYGDTTFQMDGKRYPYGGNMAFKIGVFDKIGMFNVKIGRIGKKLFGGEEYDLFQRLLESGGNGVYQPGGIVYHRIDKSRMEKDYFRRLHYSSGYQKGLMNPVPSGRAFLGVPLYIIPQFLRSIKNYAVSIFNFGLQRSFLKEMLIFNFIGLMMGFFDQWREKEY